MSCVPTPILVTPATLEPLTKVSVKDHLRVTTNADDPYIESLISAARASVEDATDLVLASSSWRVLLPGFYFQSYVLPKQPTTAISSITYKDEQDVSQTLSTSVYELITASGDAYLHLKLNQTWPNTYTHPEAVTINFTAGYATPAKVPHNLKQAMRLLIGHWYEHRETVPEKGVAPGEWPYGVGYLVWGSSQYRF